MHARSQPSPSCPPPPLFAQPCRISGEPSTGDTEAWAAVRAAQDAGLTRAIGVDRFSIQQLQALPVQPQVFMGHVALASHADIDATLAYCANHGIYVNSFGVMHGCPFTDPLVLRLASKYNASGSQVCQVWTRQQGFGMALGLGLDAAKAAEYIRLDLDIFRFNMTAAEMRQLSNL